MTAIYIGTAAVIAVLLVAFASGLVAFHTSSDKREHWLRTFESRTQAPLLVLALSIIPLLLLELLADLSSAEERTVEIGLLAIWAAFFAELGVRLALTDRKPTYVRENWLDVFIVAVPFARPLRIARSVRAARVARASRALPFLARSIVSIQEFLKQHGLRYVLLSVPLVVVVTAALELAFERDSGSMDNYGTAVWWSISTLLTVGYGDVVPQTTEGKVVAVVLMLAGISLLAWITATIAATLVEFEKGRKAVSTDELMEKLTLLENEIQDLRAEVRRASRGSCGTVRR
jgi:voltage-gated potassium channel